MKKYTSLTEVTFEDVLEVLRGWREGQYSREEVFIFAEELACLDDSLSIPELPKNDEKYVLFSTLSHLELMYGFHIDKEDIPALENYLRIGRIEPLKAIEELEEYWAKAPLEKRRNRIHES